MGSPNKLLVLLFLLFTGLLLKGQGTDVMPAKDPIAISREIEESNSKVTTLQCEFNQEKELSFLEEKAYSSGKFYFQREDKIRWEYEMPYQYIIIMNGSLIKILDEGKSNTLDASSNKLFSGINTVMTSIIDGSVINRQDLFRSTFFENEKIVRVSLEPLITGMEEFISSIELEINRSDYSVDAIKIIEKNGDYTLILFKNKIFNAPIPENNFDIQ